MKKQVLTIISLKSNEEHFFSYIEAIGYDDYKAALAAIEHIKFGKCEDFEIPSSCCEDDLIVEYFHAVGYKIEKDLDDNLIRDIFDGMDYTILRHEENDYVLESSCYDYKVGGSFNTTEIKKYNSWDEVMKNLYNPKKLVDFDICNGCNNLDYDSCGLKCMLVRGCSRDPEFESQDKDINGHIRVVGKSGSGKSLNKKLWPLFKELMTDTDKNEVEA